MGTFISISFLIGVIFILFGAPFQYAKGVMKLAYKEAYTSDKVKCMVPVYNMFFYERLYDGGAPLVGLADVLFIVLLGVRLLVVFLASDLLLWNIITTVLVVLSALFWYIANFRATFKVIHDADTKGMISTIIYSFFFPIGQFYIGNFVDIETKNRRNRGDTF
jgi:hypothetical protein